MVWTCAADGYWIFWEMDGEYEGAQRRIGGSPQRSPLAEASLWASVDVMKEKMQRVDVTEEV